MCDLRWVQQVQTVDAIEKDVVRALEGNPGWKLLHVGVGNGGQTTLTYGWPHESPTPGTTLKVSWHPNAIDAAVTRLVGFRDRLPGPSLLHDEQAVMVAIDALRTIQHLNETDEGRDR